MAISPNVIGRYQIRSRLGEGGMGVVYLAHDPAMDCDVAIKLLRDSIADEGLRKRFAREAQMARRVGIHPNVVTIFDVGDHEGRPFIAMEYVSGETLELVIRRQALPPPLRRLHIVEDLCTGLMHAHKAGLVHRDIKPANVMLTEDGTLKILDFGIARLAESDLTADGIVIGALNYMSPEQITGMPLDHRSDVFAVGALFYELLSGQRAFPGTIREGLPYRIIHGTPPPLGECLGDLDPEIERIIVRALEKDPAKRYQDIATMRQEIARVRRRLETGQIERAVLLAESAFATGDYDAVVKSCEEIAKLDPDEPRALDLLQRAAAARAGQPSITVAGRARATVEPETVRISPPAAPSVTPAPAGPSRAAAGPSRAPAGPRPSRSRVGVAAVIGVAALAAAGVGVWLSGRFSVSQPPGVPASTSAGARSPDAAASRANASFPPPLPIEAASAPTKPAPTPAAVASPETARPQQSPETVRLQRSARTQFANGHRVEALEIVEAALAKRDADPDWQAIVRSWHRQAAADVANARVEADGKQAPTKAQQSYQEAVRAEESAKELTQAGKGAAAVRTLWQAEALFVKASQQAELASQAAAAPTKPAAVGSQSAAATSQPARAASQAAGGTNGSGAGRQADAGRQPAGGGNRQADPAGQPPGLARQANFPGPSADRTGQPAGPGQRPPSASPGSPASPAEMGPAPPPEAQVRHVLREYESAWDRLDADGVRRVCPSFAGDSSPGFRNFTLRFENVQIFVNGTRAMARALLHHTPRPMAANRGTARANPFIVNFEQRQDGHWILRGMQPLQTQPQQQRQ